MGQSAPATEVIPVGLQSRAISELEEEAGRADDDEGLLLAEVEVEVDDGGVLAEVEVEVDDGGGRGEGGEGTCNSLAGVVDADDASTTPFAEDDDVDEAPLGVRAREGGGTGAVTGAARIALEDGSRNLQ